MRKSLAVLAVTLPLALAACGSTLPPRPLSALGLDGTGTGLGVAGTATAGTPGSDQAAATGAPVDGSTATTAPGDTAGTGTTTDPGTGATGGGGGTTGVPGTSATTGTSSKPAAGATKSGSSGHTSSSATAAPTTAATKSATGPAGTATGVTASQISIGVYTADGYSGLASQAGFSASTGSQATETHAVFDYINAHGGFAGRKGVPVIHDFNIADATSPDTDYQAACSDWTQDNHVYAVAEPTSNEDNTIYDCTSKAGVITVSAGEARDASFFQKYGNYFYEPADMNLRRIYTNEVDGLAAANFFGSGAKIGVVIGDDDDDRAAVTNGLVPALAKHGLKLADTFAVATDDSGATEYTSAVLRFESEGITHVLFSYNGSALLFMTSAQTQGYHPHYGLNSRNSPGSSLETNAPTAQQAGAVGVGWEPNNDVDTANDPGPVSARTTLCDTIMKGAGVDVSNRVTALVALWICDSVFYIHDVLQYAPNFTPAGFQAGAIALGNFQAATTFASRITAAGLHDGAAAYRLFAWKTTCNCYQYTGPLTPAE